jgi:nicotinate-nucleotide adenylyltransferase
MGQQQSPAKRGCVRLIIVYGGTFDPIHNGHLAVAEAAQTAFRTDVIFLPSADPPHRPPTSASAGQRADMVELAIAGYPGFSCDRRELRRGGLSYSLLSLREWRAETGPEQPIAWLIGMDSFLGLPAWHAWSELFELSHFIVVDRPEYNAKAMPMELARACEPRWADDPEILKATPAGRVFRLQMPLREESSTSIRHGFAGQNDMNAALPDAVAAFIARNRLYITGV